MIVYIINVRFYIIKKLLDKFCIFEKLSEILNSGYPEKDFFFVKNTYLVSYYFFLSVKIKIQKDYNLTCCIWNATSMLIVHRF